MRPRKRQELAGESVRPKPLCVKSTENHARGVAELGTQKHTPRAAGSLRVWERGARTALGKGLKQGLNGPELALEGGRSGPARGRGRSRG